LRIEATKLAERKNDYILALAELRVLDENQKILAKGKKGHARDSIEAPIRWRKSNLTDGKWPRSKNSVQLLALKEERETFLSSIANG